jgi:hypothetical protein
VKGDLEAGRAAEPSLVSTRWEIIVNGDEMLVLS